MRKKILTTIALICTLCMPMLVNAEEKCTVKTNYYLFHEELGQWDEEVKSICGGENNLDTCISEHPNSEVTYASKTLTAFFDNDIPSNSKDIQLNFYTVNTSSNENDIKTTNGYHAVWSDMLNKGNIMYSMVDKNDANIKYFLHTSWSDGGSDVLENRPFFMINTNFATNYNQIMNDVRNSYLIGSYGKSVTNENSIENAIYNGNDQLEIEIQRSYSFNLSMLKNGINTCNYDDCEGAATSYHLIHPSVFEIKYTVCDENTEIYTIKYDANGGTNAPSNQTKESGETINLSEQKPTRNGYIFLGWSTNPDATQAESIYNPGSSYSEDKDLTLYAVWVSETGGKGTTDNSKTGLGYSIGIIAVVLAATAGGVVYFKKRNKFENI